MTDSSSIPHLLDVSSQNGVPADHMNGTMNGMAVPVDEAGVASVSETEKPSPPVLKCNGGVEAGVEEPVVEGAVAFPSDSIAAVSKIPAEQVAAPEETPALLVKNHSLQAPTIPAGLKRGEEASSHVAEPLSGVADAPAESVTQPTGGMTEGLTQGLPPIPAGAQAVIKTEVVPPAEKNELERILDDLIR